MRVRVSVVSFALGAVVSAVLFAGPVTRAQEKAAPEAAAPGSKIAVVNRATALTAYEKQKSETTRLEAEYKRLQAPIDAMSKDIEADKKKYEDTRAKMSDGERKTFEDRVQEKFRNYQAELAKGQGTMDSMRQRSLESLVKDYLAAVKAVGASGKYLMVLEADPGSPGRAVLYASDTVDITSQVITYLNGHPSAAPDAAPVAKSKGEAAAPKKGKKGN